MYFKTNLKDYVKIVEKSEYGFVWIKIDSKFLHTEKDLLLYTASPENPYFVGELILPYLIANGIFTVTNFHRTFANKFQL